MNTFFRLFFGLYACLLFGNCFAGKEEYCPPTAMVHGIYFTRAEDCGPNHNITWCLYSKVFNYKDRSWRVIYYLFYYLNNSEEALVYGRKKFTEIQLSEKPYAISDDDLERIDCHYGQNGQVVRALSM